MHGAYSSQWYKLAREFLQLKSTKFRIATYYSSQRVTAMFIPAATKNHLRL